MPDPVAAPAVPAGHEGLGAASAAQLRRWRTALSARGQVLWDAWCAVLPPDAAIRYAPELNPPRWERGHVTWFEERWIVRHPERLRGADGNPAAPRGPSLLRDADALFDPATHTHARRWHADLPGTARLQAWAAAVRERSDALLRQAGTDAAALWVHRLALAHEACHQERWLAMAQALALPLDLPEALGPVAPAEVEPLPTLRVAPDAACATSAVDGIWLEAHERGMPAMPDAAVEIDATPVTWAQVLAFVEAGGYEDARWWTPAGWAWRQREGLRRPRHVHLDDGHWRWARFGRWWPLPLQAPALHLSAHEAEAWCRWAGRRLPTEAEWWHAALQGGERFRWGEVWEWTTDTFAPLHGHRPDADAARHAGAFGQARVLRGSSFATWRPLVDVRRRGHLPPGRTDRFTGFRSCA